MEREKSWRIRGETAGRQVRTWWSGWVGGVLGGGVLAVYVLTLAPGTLGGDPGELQFVPYILSMPHPTGTPLYCLLGKAWSMLPIGPTVAWRMNLLAAVSASLAVVLVYDGVYGRSAIAPLHLFRSSDFSRFLFFRSSDFSRFLRPVPALAAALSLAFGLTFWEQALLADKYAFNALMVGLVVVLALRWGQTRSPVTLHLLALAYGLSLAHHRTMSLFAPTLLGYVWWFERGALWRDRRRLLRLVVLCLLPLLLYLYLPWAKARNLPPGTWHPRTARQWFDYLFDTGRTGLVYVDPADLGEMLLFYARTLQRDFTWVGVVLGVGGLAWQLANPFAVNRFFRSSDFSRFLFARWLDAAFLLVNFGLQAFLAANHHVPRHWVYFIPSFLIFSLWIGEGLSAIWLGIEWILTRNVFRRLPPLNPFVVATGIVPMQVASVLVLAVATLAWPLLPFGERYRPLREAHLGAGVLDVWRQTIKQGHMGDRLGRSIAGVDAHAIIVCDWEQATPLWYFQQVEGLRPDVQVLYPIERLDEAAGLGRPLYLARTLPGVAHRWHPSCSDALIALHNSPTPKLPDDVTTLGIQFVGASSEGGSSDASCRLPQAPVDVDRIELAAFRYGPTGFCPAQVVPLTLYWRAIAAPAHDYSVSLRLLNGAGEQVFAVDSQHPVLGAYPTSMWTAGEVVGDYYEIQLPLRLPPGTYQWGVILYRTLPGGGWQSLRVEHTEAEMATGGSFEINVNCL